MELAKFSAFALLAAGALFGQSVDPKTYSAPGKDRVKLAAARMLPSLGAAVAPPVPQILDPVTESERRAVPELPGVPAAGLHRRLALPATRTGHWETIGNRHIWRASIHSPGARSLRVHFSAFNAGTGRVWVHNGSTDQPEIGGPYTGLGWTADGDFWSDIVFGDTLVIEYEPASIDRRVPFEVTEISHALSAIAQAEADPEGPRLAALSCHQDASCFPEWADTGKAVARYVFEKDGGSYLCTGTLLNTRQSRNIPYLITADHCVDSDAVARTVQAFWFYQTSRCNGPAPATRDLPRSLGARYLAGGGLQQGDFTLLRLTDVPNGVVFSGWSADPVDMGAALTGVHHPAGDYRRLSQGRRAADSTMGTGLVRDRFYSVQWAAGHTEGGSSGSGLFSAPGRLVGTLYGGLRTATGVTKCDLDPDYSFYGRFETAYPTLRDFLEDRDTATTNPGTGAGALLTSGQPQSFTTGPVASPTLLNAGTSLYRIVVPAGATRLTVRVTTETQGADVDLHLRYGAAPAVQGGRVVADYSSETGGGAEEITVDNSSTPVLRAGVYYIALALYTPNLTVRGQITATVADTPATVRLTSRQPRPFRFGAVSGPTLMNAPSSLFEVEVPEGARRLQIKLSTTTPNADLDLYARFGNNPSIAAGKVVADFGSDSETGTELITITPSSSPPLQAGIYRIALLVFTPGIVTEGTVEAIVETTDQEPPAEPALLTSGQPLPFSLASVAKPTLYTGVYGYRVEVPEGAARLQVRVVSNDPRVDIDLYLRAGAPVDLSADGVLADFAAETDSGNETITVTGGTSPPLAPGTYYAGVVLYTPGVPATGFVTATVEPSAAPPVDGCVLTGEEAQTTPIPAVAGPTLFGGDSITTNLPATASCVPQKAEIYAEAVPPATPKTGVNAVVR
ncbi:MAG: PPC domain-containing protein [Bryobacterales bacterium]|nr:PPC domain-containing protein [Bryobacterales bacterium]